MPLDSKRIQSVFLAAVEAADRPAVLARECGDDADLRRRVEALLQAHDAPGTFLDQPAGTRGSSQEVVPGRIDPAAPHLLGADAAGLDEKVGSCVGPYKLLQKLGEGGMGAVYMAEQNEPVKRRVALKIIKAGMDSERVLARFEAERQALAMMDHPNIASVLDAGTVEGARDEARGTKEADAEAFAPRPRPLTSRPYFVMELVKGIPITKFCDHEHLTPKERLQLFVPICPAVQHAHQKGIIHRDIKPSNVLIALYDGKPVPKIIDFGLAKATAQKLTDRTMFTEFGQIVGTLEYMAPEQAELNNLDIDTRADIYSLGALLYELLTGSPPFTTRQLRSAAFTEMMRIIRESEPPKPSTKLSSSEELPSIAANRKTEPAKLARLVRGDLDWIVMKALEKDRGRRYDTANDFARDIERYLAHEAVEACPPSAGYRLRKFIRRNRGAVLAAATILLVLVGGIFGTTWGMLRAEAAAGAEKRAKETAQQSDAVTKAVLDFVETKIFAAARPKDQEGGQGFDVKLADAVKAALPFVDKSFTSQPLIEARLRMTMGTSFWYLGDARTAIEQFQAARRLYTEHRGPDHLATLGSITWLANAYADAGRAQEALLLREEALPLLKAKLGTDHPDTLLCMNNLANSYAAAGKIQKAIDLHEKTLQLRKAKLGPDAPDTLKSMNNLANCYAAAGDNQKALELREETLQLCKAKLRPNHHDTLMSMNNLASSYAAVGRTKEALEFFEDTLKRMKVNLGPGHRDALASMNNLAVLYAAVGRAQDALELREETFRLYKANCGPDHPDTLNSMNNLVVSYIAIGDVAQAVAILKETLTLRERRVKDEPENSLEESFLAWTHGQMGEAEQARLEYAAAAQAYARSVEKFEKLDQAGALNDPFFRSMMNLYRERLLDMRVRYLLKEQKLAAAVESAAKMKERAGDKAVQLYNVACAYALCAGAAMNPVANAPSADKLADEAMALLKQAVAQGFNDADYMKKDDDLGALRERDDFKKLLAELEAKK
jgi:serine/threonine protein kinase